MRIEYPVGSGVFADYSDPERSLMREFYRAAADGEITVDERDQQLAFIHDLKVTLDATLIADEAEEEGKPPLPATDSPFQIPEKARARLSRA